MKIHKIYAISGSCFNELITIYGYVDNNYTFISSQFTGNIKNNNFWETLKAYARKRNKLIKLVYKE